MDFLRLPHEGWREFFDGMNTVMGGKQVEIDPVSQARTTTSTVPAIPFAFAFTTAGSFSLSATAGSRSNPDAPVSTASQPMSSPLTMPRVSKSGPARDSLMMT